MNNINGPTYSAYDIFTDINNNILEKGTRFWYHDPNGIMFSPLGFVELDSSGYPLIQKNQDNRLYITFIDMKGYKTIAYLDIHTPSFSVIDHDDFHYLYEDVEPKDGGKRKTKSNRKTKTKSKSKRKNKSKRKRKTKSK